MQKFNDKPVKENRSIFGEEPSRTTELNAPVQSEQHVLSDVPTIIFEILYLD